MKTTLLLFLLLTVVHEPALRIALALPQLNMLPPDYLGIPNFKSCTVSKTKIGTHFRQVCLPDERPYGCDLYTWDQVRASSLCPCYDLDCQGEQWAMQCEEFENYYLYVCMFYQDEKDEKGPIPKMNMQQRLLNHSRSELSCPSITTNTVARRDEKVLKKIVSAKECSTKCREKTTCKFWSWASKGRYALDCVLVSGYGKTVRDHNVISGPRTCNPENPLQYYSGKENKLSPKNEGGPGEFDECNYFDFIGVHICILASGGSKASAKMNMQQAIHQLLLKNSTSDLNPAGMGATPKMNIQELFDHFQQLVLNSSTSGFDMVKTLSCPSNHTNTVARRDQEVVKRIGSAEECSTKCREKTTCKFWSWANNSKGRYALDCVLVSGFGKTVRDDNVISGPRNCHPKN